MKHRVLSLAVSCHRLPQWARRWRPQTAASRRSQLNLIGYQETPVTINSPGSGELAAKNTARTGSEIQYDILSGRGLTTTVPASPHPLPVAQPSPAASCCSCARISTPPANVTPAPPACPQAPADGSTVAVSGTLAAVNLLVAQRSQALPLPTQGIDPGAAVAEIVAAIRNGAAYANVRIRRRCRAARFAVRLVRRTITATRTTTIDHVVDDTAAGSEGSPFVVLTARPSANPGRSRSRPRSPSDSRRRRARADA